MNAHDQSSNYKLRVPDEVADLIRGLHPQLKRKIKAALKFIIAEPGEGKSLRDKLNGLRSYKVSLFRIIYRISSDNYLEIVAIGPRKTIYEETFRIIKKEEKKSSK
jgi:mRNA interferase RelE/StbE